MNSDFSGDLWYNKCKEKCLKSQKSLHMEWEYIQIQRWKDQYNRFRSAYGNASE